MTRLLVFDLETDSPDPLEAHIVTAYMGLLDDAGRVILEQEWLVRPEGFVIPEEATKIHGITHDHAAANGSPLADVLRQIVGIIEVERLRAPLAGQNISYDLTVLAQEWARIHSSARLEPTLSGLTVLDSYILDKHLFRFRKGAGARKLINLAAAYGVHLTEEEAHGARADAIAAGRIIQKQLANPKLREIPLPQLHQWQIRWAAEQAADLQTWFRTKGGKPNEVVNGDWPLRKAAA